MRKYCSLMVNILYNNGLMHKLLLIGNGNLGIALSGSFWKAVIVNVRCEMWRWERTMLLWLLFYNKG